jgi:FHA domain-containing protein
MRVDASGEPVPSAEDQDPFAGLMPPPAGVPADSAAVAVTPAPLPILPDDFDPFAEPEEQQMAARNPVRTHSPPRATDVFEDLVPPGQQPSLDAVFGLGPMAADDPLARFLDPPAPTTGSKDSAALGTVSTDPMALFASTSDAAAAPATTATAAAPPAQPAATQMAQPDNVAALHAAFKPPRTAAQGHASTTVPLPAPPAPLPPVTPAAHPPAYPRAPALEPMPAPNPAASGHRGSSPAPRVTAAETAAAAALWAAFCDGAGLTNVQLPGAPEQQMHELGRILRSATEGTLQLMAVRSSTRYELRAGVTIIQQRNNNPLKFSPDAVAALTQMLQPPMRGFLNGPAAMDEAMHDLVGHSIGTVAGLRAAVEGMLERFAPQELERKLSSHSVFDSVLPSARKARLWDLYLQHHQGIREEAQEDFHTLFGKAFLAAYEQQIERLRSKAAQR